MDETVTEPVRACRACGHPNARDAKFCAECGARLSMVCVTCQAPIDAAQRFCSNCGAPLAGAAAGADPGPAGDARSSSGSSVAERRVCAVLFCDLVGFTTLSERVDPEHAREILSQYFAVARTVIARYGGIVEKFIGDAVMAVWGTPIATEDDSERAVRAALDLADAVSALGVDLGLTAFAVRVGVVTGETAVTIGATGEGMVAGDAVNTASRVQTAASAGSVFVDDATKRAAEAAIAFVDAGPHELKGKAEPVRLWQASRVLAGVRGAGRVDGLEAPLIGRDVELRLLKDLFHATASRREPRLVIVSGAAGAGKSRLGWEFEKYIDGLSGTVRWHRGRCLSYGEGVAFWALAEVVRQRLGIAEEDTPELGADKLVAGVARFIVDETERAFVGIRLGRLLGLRFPNDDGEELQRESLFAGWRIWLMRLAEVEPVVLLIEDLHHADAGLLEFVDHVLDWARTAPIYVVAFARPDLEERRPGWSLGRHRQQISLDPLDRSSMSQLLEDLVPGMPAAAQEAILAQAHGIPLFAIETIRSLVDRDIVVAQDGFYRLVGEIGELDVPDSLRALLAARLDLLEPRTRSLVADAAVLGDTFPADALTAVTGRPADQVNEDLRLLVRRELFTVSADLLSPQQGFYAFAHEMLRRVAYGTLSRRDRKTRHLAVAHHLRQTFPNDGDEVADVIARHLLDAGDAVPDDPDVKRIRRDAVAELVRAGDRARGTGAQARAAINYATAAEHTDDSGERAYLYERASIASDIAWDYATVITHADHARAVYEESHEVLDMARMDSIAAHALSRLEQIGQARTRFAAALDVLRPARTIDTVRALLRLATLEIWEGNPVGDALSAEALDLGEALQVPAVEMSELFLVRAAFHEFLNHSARSMVYLREAARYAVDSMDDRQAGRALSWLAVGLADSDPSAALDVFMTAADHFRRVGDRMQLGAHADNVTESQIHLGLWDDAETAIVQAITVDGVGDSVYVALARARLSALRGDVRTARSAVDELGDVGLGGPQLGSTQAFVLATLHDADDRPELARESARLALSFRETVGINFLPIRWSWALAVRLAHRAADIEAQSDLLDLLGERSVGVLSPMLAAERDLALARLAAAESDPQAPKLMDAAIIAERAGSTPYHLAHALIDAGELHHSLGDTEQAAALVTEALDIAQRLKAAPLVHRAEELRHELAQVLAPS